MEKKNEEKGNKNKPRNSTAAKKKKNQIERTLQKLILLH